MWGLHSLRGSVSLKTIEKPFVVCYMRANNFLETGELETEQSGMFLSYWIQQPIRMDEVCSVFSKEIWNKIANLSDSWAHFYLLETDVQNWKIVSTKIARIRRR